MRRTSYAGETVKAEDVPGGLHCQEIFERLLLLACSNICVIYQNSLFLTLTKLTSQESNLSLHPHLSQNCLESKQCWERHGSTIQVVINRYYKGKNCLQLIVKSSFLLTKIVYYPPSLASLSKCLHNLGQSIRRYLKGQMGGRPIGPLVTPNSSWVVRCSETSKIYYFFRFIWVSMRLGVGEHQKKTEKWSDLGNRVGNPSDFWE